MRVTDDHKRVTLGDLCQFTSGNGFRPSDWKPSGLPIIRIQNLNGSQSFNYFDGEPEDGWIVEPGDLLFAWAGVKGVSFGPKIWPGPRGVLNQHIYRVVVNPGVDQYWMCLALQMATSRIESRAHGFKSSLVHVHKDDIVNQVVDLPLLPEQRKIAAILRTWDEALEKLEALRAAKQKKLSSLRQKLFGLRDQFRSEWPLRSLSELSTRIQRQNCGNDYPVMTISAKSGFLLQSDKYSRDMAGRSLENYIVLHEGEFAYNKGNSLTYPQGCIFPLERPAALVPRVYFCFALKEGLNRNFYAHLFEAGLLNRQLTRLINSGVRNDGLLNINAADFFSCCLPMPDLETQQTIAMVLTTAKKELALLDAELEALTCQKRGLMQKLLTGEWRTAV